MTPTKLAASLSDAQRTIVLRTPLQVPARAYFIAVGNITSGMVAAFGRSHDFLFTRFQPNGTVPVEYRLTPLGAQVRAVLEKENDGG